jgi:uncharacterized protein
MEEIKSPGIVSFPGVLECAVALALTIFVIIVIILIVRARRGRGGQIIGGRGSASSFWWFVPNNTPGVDFEGGGSSGSW